MKPDSIIKGALAVIVAGVITYYAIAPTKQNASTQYEKIDNNHIKIVASMKMDGVTLTKEYVENVADIKAYITRLEERILTEPEPRLVSMLQFEHDRQLKILEVAVGIGIENAK